MVDIDSKEKNDTETLKWDMNCSELKFRGTQREIWV